MFNQKNKVLLGILLQNADLISDQQLETALETQSQYTQMKLGEILVLQEGIRAKTIDFFVNQWQELITQGQQFPIGYYLETAALLNEQQVRTILQEQKSNQEKFGTLAAKKGWIKQSTINFILDSLSQPPELISLISLEEYNKNIWHLEKKYANFSLILSRILAWTGGNTVLTKTICHIFADADFNISPGAEINTVDQLVERSFVRKWRTEEAAKYIRLIRQKFVNNSRCDSNLLLEEYRSILLSGNKQYQYSSEQNELITLGLIVKENDNLRVANIIYQQVFTEAFVDQELNHKKQKNNSITQANAQQDTTEIVEYIPNSAPSKIVKHADNSEVTKLSTIKNKPDNLIESNPDSPEPLTKISSLITLAAIALLVPLFLIINNYYSSLLEPKQEDNISEDSLTKAEELEQFCHQLDLTDASASLRLISQLEKDQKALPKNTNNNWEVFPNNCKVALNHLRVLAAPQLGKENRILEAIRNLCKVPADSEMYLDAEVWLKRWYNSSSWGEETKFYLEEFAKYNHNSECPAAHFTEYES